MFDICFDTPKTYALRLFDFRSNYLRINSISDRYLPQSITAGNQKTNL